MTSRIPSWGQRKAFTFTPAPKGDTLKDTAEIVRIGKMF